MIRGLLCPAVGNVFAKRASSFGQAEFQNIRFHRRRCQVFTVKGLGRFIEEKIGEVIDHALIPPEMVAARVEIYKKLGI